MKYIVPEYYQNFNCKCGECRHSCCEGWPIRISLKEYYRLLGINCSDKLRARLDCALKICSDPSNECYAEVSTDWNGICMLHREDGLCMIQAELGEDSLPEVCRLYPRNIKLLYGSCVCSCSNSCEKVIELLMNRKGPLLFEEKALSVKPEFEINLSYEKYEICKNSVVIIQNRNLSLAERFLSLGSYLKFTEIIPDKPAHLLLAYQALNTFDKYFESSVSAGDYCKAVQNYFCLEGKEQLNPEDLIMITDKHRSASEHLESILPDWQILFEQLFVNHMVYSTFPYSCNPESVKDAFLSLTILYSFLRFNTLGYMSDKKHPEEMVGFLAAMFRLIDHSDFNYISIRLFKREKYPLQQCVTELLYL